MAIDINLPDDDVQHLNPPARQQLQANVEDYIDQLLEESSRLEAVQRTSEGDPEINSSMVKDAALLIGRGYQRQKKPGWLRACQIVATLSALLTGFVFDFERLKDPIMLVVFVLILAAAITFNVIVLMKD